MIFACPRTRTTHPLGQFLRDIMCLIMNNFRVFGPDENSSNKLDDVYEVSKKTWLADYLPEDADGGELSPDGRVMEMLSEHTLEGWLEGYLLTGRHGFFSTYEAFVHVIDSMFNQHAKWLAMSKEVPCENFPELKIRFIIKALLFLKYRHSDIDDAELG